jgi:hypothetical protein
MCSSAACVAADPDRSAIRPCWVGPGGGVLQRVVFSVSTPVRDSTVRYTYERVLWLSSAFVAAVRPVFSHRIVALRRTLRWLSSVLGLRCGLGSA